jgi:hypothetical protein
MKLREKLPKFIKSITILKVAAEHPLAQRFDRIELLPKRRRKRSRGLLRILERIVLGRARVLGKISDVYIARHDRSAKKRRDGWLRDLRVNRIRAVRRGRRAFGLSRLLS